MNEYNILSVLVYISGLINEFKKTKEKEREIILIHLMNIFEQIKLLASDEHHIENDNYADEMNFCAKKMFSIIEEYKSNSNFVFTNELEEIKKKLKTLMFICN